MTVGRRPERPRPPAPRARRRGWVEWIRNWPLRPDEPSDDSRDVRPERWSPRTRRTVVVFIAILVALVLWGARDILGPFVWAGIFAYVLNPAVNLLRRVARVPRPLAVALLYVIGVGLVVAAAILLVPLIRSELDRVTSDLPEIIEGAERSLPAEILGQPLSVQGLVDTFNASVTAFLSDTTAAVGAFRTAFEGVVHMLLALVAAAYLLLAGPRLVSNMISLLPVAQRAEASVLVASINRVFGGFIRGELILVVIMSVTTYIGLSIIGVPFALVIAIATGFLELIPVFGPVIAAVPPIALALVTQNNFELPGWLAATVVAIMYTVLRQVEDYLVIPNVVGRVVRVHPLVALFALFAGLQIWGVTGMIIALPVAGVARVLLGYVYRRTVTQ